MMKAGHVMTMTRENGERRSRSFNTHSNRPYSSSDYADCGDVNFQSANVSGPPTDQLRELDRQNSRCARAEHPSPYTQSTETSTAPSSPGLLPDILSPTSPVAIARSNSARSSRRRSGRDFPEHEESVDPDGDNRLPRRSRSARENSRERRKQEGNVEKTNFAYHGRRYVAPDVQLLPPPRIVTTIDDHNGSPLVSPSDSDRSGVHFAPPGHHLTVPGYESPTPIVPDFGVSPRSRSRSASDSQEFRRSSLDRKQACRVDLGELEGKENFEQSEAYHDMRSQVALNLRKSNPEDRDRRVSYDPGDDETEEKAAYYRERTRKYSCIDVRVTGDKTGWRCGPYQQQQQQELRRLVSSETPRRRFLPPTPDQLIRHRRNEAGSSSGPYLDVNYGGSTKKAFLLSSSSLPGGCQVAQETDSVSVRRQLSSAAGSLLKDNEARSTRSTTPPQAISAANDPRSVTRPGSGRKLPAEPPEIGPVPSSPGKSSPDDRRGAGSGKMLSRSSSSEDEDRSAPSSSSGPAATKSTLDTPSVGPSRKMDSGKQNLFKKFHQSSVSSSSSVPDFQINGPPKPTACQVVEAGVVGGVDPATDSGHGSGAESGLGDGVTVSASNSWPDAIVSSSSTECKQPTGTDSLTPTGGGDGIRRRSVVTITPPPSPSAGGIGLLHFTLQYFPVRKRLRVSIIKAELRMDAELNAFVKICLNPGKLQKQRGSRVVKRSKEATFNEEFFFDNITSEDLERKIVYVRLCHHAGRQFQKDIVIGQMEGVLKDFLPLLSSKQDVKTCQELKPKQLKKLGRLQISTCLEKEARRLTFNIFKADDLPKFGITGPPDPFIRISVDQNGWVQTKQSRTLKSTCNAVFKEAVMFLVSTKVEDLERTKIVISVHDAARSASGDDAIGHVYLGQLAGEKTEVDQWRNSISHFGREFKATHQLKRDNESGDGADED